jgi:hypothetical protein
MHQYTIHYHVTVSFNIILPQVYNYVENFMLIKNNTSTINHSRWMPYSPSMTKQYSVEIQHLASLPLTHKGHRGHM